MSLQIYYKSAKLKFVFAKMVSRATTSTFPIILEQCEIANKLRHLTYLDLTLDNNTLTELQKLKDALLPGDEMIKIKIGR
jgi:hypothetical protein